MFGIGMPEMLLILAVALIVIGPKKLPDLAKSMGRALGEFKKATTEFKETLEIDTEITEVKKAFDNMNETIHRPLDVAIDSIKEMSTEDAFPDAPMILNPKDRVESDPEEEDIQPNTSEEKVKEPKNA